MGASSSNEELREKPNKDTDATLYYFAGRGLADQIRYHSSVAKIFQEHVKLKTTNLESTNLFSLQMDAGSNISQFHNPDN